MYSITKEKIHNNIPFKSWKIHVSPDAEFNSLLRTIFIVISIFSITLCFYIGFLNPCIIKCDHNSKLFHISGHRKFTVGNFEIEKTNVSHILFGIGGTAKTWDARRHYCELWWKPNVTRGFVWLDENPNQPWPATSPNFKISNDTSRFKYDCVFGTRSALRIARIVKEGFELGLENVRWFVLGDDDTVFFVENLVSVLGKYDHNQMYYIGGNSESVEQDMVHSYSMAYGGGGIAISYPLAAELVRILDGCIDRYSYFYGSDQQIQGCLSEIGVPLTKELGFHQIDIRGNPYGILAAHPIAPLVSLHHLDYVNALFPRLTQIDSLKQLRSSYKMDPGRTLQHSFCHDPNRNWSISISWGYTIQIYPSLLTAKDLETPILTFQSWKSWSNEPFTINTRYMGPDPCDRPILYFFDEVNDNVNGSGLTVTSYRKFVDEKECLRPEYAPALAVQNVNVSASILNSDYWKLAPRRQCCEVMNSGEGVDSAIQVNIKSCNAFESVTPP